MTTGAMGYVPSLGALPGDDEPECPLGCEHIVWTDCCGSSVCTVHQEPVAATCTHGLFLCDEAECRAYCGLCQDDDARDWHYR